MLGKMPRLILLLLLVLLLILYSEKAFVFAVEKQYKHCLGDKLAFL